MHKQVFVFGSNMSGVHGKGSAREAWTKHGAQWGVGSGRTGNAYAIPTKMTPHRTLSLGVIQNYVHVFRAYALMHPELTFNVVAIGCGNAGYTAEEIAPMFKDAPSNVVLPPEFKQVFDK